MIAALRPWFSLVRFSHSVFALPFALLSAWLAAGGMPAPRVLVLSASISARVAASSSTGECRKRPPSGSRTAVMRAPISMPATRSDRSNTQRFSSSCRGTRRR